MQPESPAVPCWSSVSPAPQYSRWSFSGEDNLVNVATPRHSSLRISPHRSSAEPVPAAPSGEYHCGRFGLLPELFALDTSTQREHRYSAPPDVDGSNDSATTTASPSMSSALLSQWGIVLSGHGTSHTWEYSRLPPTDGLPASTLLSETSADFLLQSTEDPSAYFSALQDAVTDVLEAEKEKRRREEQRQQEEERQREKQRQREEQRQKEEQRQREEQRQQEEQRQRDERRQKEQRQRQQESQAQQQVQQCHEKEEREGGDGVKCDTKPVVQPQYSTKQENGVSRHEDRSGDTQLSVQSSCLAFPVADVSLTIPQLSDAYIVSKLRLHQQWKNYMRNDYAQIKDDPHHQIKRFRLSTKKAVTLAVNQLASTSSQVDTVASKLVETLMALYNRTSGDAQHARLYRYALTTTLEALLNNVEVQVVSNPRAVWGFGALLPRLCECPELRLCFESSLIDRCSYVIPYMTETGSSLLGQNASTMSGQKPGETQIQYAQRMAAYLRLWLVFLVITRETAQVWSWFARFLNASLPVHIAPCLLSSALEVCGFVALQSFPTQFRKILSSSIAIHTLPLYYRLREGDRTGIVAASITQIEVLLDTFRRSNSLPVSDGFNMKAEARQLSRDL